MSAPRSPGRRAGLSRAAVVAAARELIAEEGADALSMRALAARLGVRPNALYSHVESKAALVDAVLDDVLAEVRAPDPQRADPARALRTIMSSTFEVLLAHAELVPLYVSRGGARGENARRLGAIMLALLARAGLSEARAGRALRVLVTHAIGSAAFAVRPPLGAAAGDAEPPPHPDPRGDFDAGLRWLLAGILSEPGRRRRRAGR